MTIDEVIVEIEVTDQHGYGIGLFIPVHVIYCTETDGQYGADADGRNGQTRTEIEILDVDMEVKDVATLTLGQVEALITEARQLVLRRAKVSR